MEPKICAMDIFQELVCEVLERGETSIFRVYGRSMLPTIVNGDIAHVIRFDATQAKVGNILVYKRENSLCVHRLVFKLRDNKTGSLTLTTAGDGLTYLDAPVDAVAVIGKVVAIEHDGKIRSFDTFFSKIIGMIRVFLARYPTIRTILRKIKLSVKSVQRKQLIRLGEDR